MSEPDFETMAHDACVSADLLRRIDADGYRRGQESTIVKCCAIVKEHCTEIGEMRDMLRAIRALLAPQTKDGGGE